MVKFTTVVNGEIVTLNLDREQFGRMMEELKRRAKRNKLEKRKAEVMKGWGR